MIERIEAVALEGQSVRVTARDPLPAEPRLLTLAVAVRVFDRYPLFVRLAMTVSEAEIGASREDIRRLLGPQALRGLDEPGRWRELLAQIVEAVQTEDTG